MSNPFPMEKRPLCRWCKKKLRLRVLHRHTREDEPPVPEGAVLLPGKRAKDKWGYLNFRYVCKGSEFGYNGRGHFCTVRCAAAFGDSVAGHGAYGADDAT